MAHPLVRFLFLIEITIPALSLTGCETTGAVGIQEAKLATTQAIQRETPVDYYYDRRYYKIPQYKFWGYVRQPGQPWSTAKLVVFNEKQKLAPDREQLNFDCDNNYEIKRYGSFSGDTV